MTRRQAFAGFRFVKPRAGFTLVSAVFLLAVVALAGAFMVRLAGVQRTTTSFALLGARAYHAARSGVEWNLQQALNVPGSCPAGPPTSSSFSLTEAGTAGFDVSVTCESSVHVEGAVTGKRFHVTALAEWGSFGDRDYVSRRVETTFTDVP